MDESKAVHPFLCPWRYLYRKKAMENYLKLYNTYSDWYDEGEDKPINSHIIEAVKLKTVCVVRYEAPEKLAETSKYHDSNGGIYKSGFSNSDGTVRWYKHTFSDGVGELWFDDRVGGVSHAFFECNTITSVTFPPTLTSIGNYTFFSCNNLRRVNTGGHIKFIYEDAFFYCSSLEEFDFNEGIREIGRSAFGGCSSLKEVKLPDSLETMDNRAFDVCTSLTALTFGSGLKVIPFSCFNNNNKLPELTIPDNITDIDNDAFWNCSGLTSVTIGNGVTYIGADAFRQCFNLSQVDIGSGITYIGRDSFGHCASAMTIKIRATAPPELSEYLGLYSGSKVYVPRDSVNAYKTAPIWEYYEDQIYPLDE